jgi:hypothetical protein
MMTVAMIGDENGDVSVSLSSYSQKANANPNPGKPITWLLLRTVSEESKLRNILSIT